MNLPATIPTDEDPVVVSSLLRLRAEGNFLRFPFFDLTRESAQDERGSISLTEIRREPDGSRTETAWSVSRDMESPFPGEFARRLHREVVERLLSDLPRPVQNPIRLGSFSDICRMLSIEPSGAAIRRIRTSLCSIVSTTVRSTSAFYSKARDSYLDKTFHLYDRVDFAGDKQAEGQLFDAIYVYLGSWYLENINASYLIPLDLPFFRKLKGAVTSRLYELAHHWFYAALRNQKTTVDRRYSFLCAYFPLSRQPSFWIARKQLRPAIRQLVSLGFFANEPEWIPAPEQTNDWTLTFTAGPRAIEEYHANQRRRGNQESLAPSETAALPPPLSEVQRDLLTELVKRGVTDSVATSLVERHEPAAIQDHLEVFDWLVSRNDKRISRNAAGYLRTAIERKYARPDGFLTRAQREKQAIEKVVAKRAEQDAQAEKLRNEQERADRLDALWNSLSTVEQDEVTKLARSRIPDFASKMLLKEEQEGRRSIGHEVLRAEIHKLLAAKSPDAAGA